MPIYQVEVTGTGLIEVEANSKEEAEALAPEVITEVRFGIWDMHIEFEAFDEEE